MVLAAAEGSLMRAMEELPRRVTIQLKFVLADAAQIHDAIETYYPASTATPSRHQSVHLELEQAVA